MKKIISIGTNCEVSYQIERYVEKMESSLFSWAFTLDDDKFLEALENIDDIFENDKRFKNETNDMFLDEKYNISFHGRISKNEFLDEDGNIINQEVYQQDIDELKSRINHLKDKFNHMFDENNEIILLRKQIIQAKSENDIKNVQKYILKLYDYFKRKSNDGNFKLVIVIETKYYEPSFVNLENDKLFIRTVDFFSPIQDTKDGADNLSWKKIIAEFLGEEANIDVRELEIRNKKLEELYINSEYENRKLKDLLDEKNRWVDEVIEAKKWLEDQYRRLIQK